ncbi:2-keto-4-pentenoate hydratase [Mycolicibacter longobardus]|uniref:2-keto-4-pentenoate hydratase n=1 Tax=Mycolicibacter longobardus TaxID=1108812 RepID=UPI001F1D31AF|nr:fumarylacetoacetate hydrolase family protein [Mycolicibacter longobardus]
MSPVISLAEASGRAAAATSLWRAERLCRPIEPLHNASPDLNIDDAYAIQRRNIARRVDAGSAICGYKVGLASPVMQQMMGVYEPCYGHLLTDMMADDGDTVKLCGRYQPRIEVEVAFVLGDKLPGIRCTERDVLRATDYVTAAIEVIDTRIQDWRIGIVDAIADNACAARFVLGWQGCPPWALDLADVDAVLYSGHPGREVIVTRGNTGMVQGNPASAVAWLARALARSGVRLEAGDTILSGACTQAFDVGVGDRFRAGLAGIGAVSVEFW